MDVKALTDEQLAVLTYAVQAFDDDDIPEDFSVAFGKTCTALRTQLEDEYKTRKLDYREFLAC